MLGKVLFLTVLSAAVFTGLHFLENKTEPYFDVCRTRDCVGAREFTLLDLSNFTVHVTNATDRPRFDVNFVATQRSDGAVHRVPHLMRSSLLREGRCRFRGGARPYMHCNGTNGLFDGLYLDVTLDEPKDEVAELTAALASTNDTELVGRYTFFLALALERSGDHEGALARYRQRARQGGWRAEQFYALFRAGFCQLALDRLDEAKKTLQAAYELDPTRKEPLYYLARVARVEEHWPDCLLYSGAALQLGSAWADALFVDSTIYFWKLEDERALCLARVGRTAEARWHWENVLGRAPAADRERIRKNLALK